MTFLCDLLSGSLEEMVTVESGETEMTCLPLHVRNHHSLIMAGSSINSHEHFVSCTTDTSLYEKNGWTVPTGYGRAFSEEQSDVFIKMHSLHSKDSANSSRAAAFAG